MILLTKYFQIIHDGVIHSNLELLQFDGQLQMVKKCSKSDVRFWENYPPTHVLMRPILANIPTYPKIGRHLWTAP